MAKLRNVQFLRNSVLVDSRSAAITKMKDQLNSLKDGELIIGRYTEGEGTSQVVRSVLGVAYINESGRHLEIIPDNQISDIIKALANAGETIAAKNDDGIVTIYKTITETNGVIDIDTAETNQIVLKKVATTGNAVDVTTATVEGANYTTSDLTSQNWKTVVDENALATTDDVETSVEKLDTKIAGLANELIADERVIKDSFKGVKEGVGLNDDFTASFENALTDELRDDTSVKQAIYTLESKLVNTSNTTIDGHKGNITTGNGITDVTTDSGSFAVKAKNGGYISVTSDGVDVKNVDTAGTSTTATDLATVKTVTEHINALDTTTDVQAVTLTDATTTTGAKLVFNGVKEVNGVIAAGSLTRGLDLALVATTGESKDVVKTTDSTAVYDTTAEEISEDWISVVNNNKIADGDTVDADLSKLDNKIAGLANELIADENVINNTFAQVQSSVGLEDDMTLDLTGTNYIDDDTNVKDALTTLDGEIKSINDEIDGMYLAETAIVTLNGADVQAGKIKEENGQVTVQNATTVFSFNQAVSSSNKAATMADITAANITVSDETENAVSVAKTNNDYKVTLGINANDKVLTQSADGLLANLSMTYDSTTKKIYLKGKTTGTGEEAAPAIISEIDATNFLKDGMLDKVQLVVIDDEHPVEGKTNGTYLKFTFNTDAGKEVIYVDVTSLIDVYEADDVYLTLDGKTFKHKVTTTDHSSYARGTDTTSSAYGGTNTIKVPSIKVDAAGHVTGISDVDVTITMPAKQEASDVAYTNTTSGLTSSTVQAAIDELNTNITEQKAYMTVSDGTNSISASDHKGTLTVTGGAKITTKAAENKLSIEHDNSGVTTGTYGPSANVTSTAPTATTDGTAVINVPELTIDAQGHVTAASNKVLTVNLPKSIATAVQTVLGDTTTNDQRDALNNEEYVNVRAERAENSNDVKLQSSVKTVDLENATAAIEEDGWKYIGNVGSVTLQEGDLVAWSNSSISEENYSNITYTYGTDGSQSNNVNGKDFAFASDYATLVNVDGTPKGDLIETKYSWMKGVTTGWLTDILYITNNNAVGCSVYRKQAASAGNDGLTTAVNVRNYIDSHEPQVAPGSNVTVATSMNGDHKVYTVSVADAQSTTVSATDGETTVTETPGTNTTDYQVGLADVTCTKAEDTDNYTDATATHKRISSITVDAKGRVTGYTETTVTEDWDCGTF